MITEKEVISQIRSYRITPEQRRFIERGLSKEGVSIDEFKGKKKSMGFKYDFSTMSIRDKFGNTWVEVDIPHDNKLGGRMRILHKDHIAPQLERLLKERGKLPRGVRMIERMV